MADVFVSYARPDEPQAQRVAEALRAVGYRVWRDDELPAHRAYADVIQERLSTAQAVVVLWSAEAAKSQWVRAEAEWARTGGTLVQAVIDGTIPPLPFNQIQCADLSGWRGNRKHRGWTKLVDGVSSIVAGEPPQPAQPAQVRRRPRLDRRSAIAVIGSILLLIVAAVIFLPRLTGIGEEKPPRVAVLPFKNVGGSDEESALFRALSIVFAMLWSSFWLVAGIGPDGWCEAERPQHAATELVLWRG